jgi:nitrogenase-stabilizing/protective protein
MTVMEKTLSDFRKLVNAEDYLAFFGIDYDQQFVNVNRLHILKQFSLLINEVDKAFSDISEPERLDKYRQAFAEAYELFRTHSPLETKLFKVFNEKPKNVVLLEDLTKNVGVK